MPANTSIIMIMGVAGSGKSTIGRRLALDLGWQYFEADDFHPADNVEKMGKGIPLTDSEREPWLQAIRDKIDDCLKTGQRGVFTCSALKERYRQILFAGAKGISPVFLHVSPELAAERLNTRPGHFMKADMVGSQFAALEVPDNALVIDTTRTVDQILGEIHRALKL